MDIKHALKEAKQFLGAGKSELALGILKEFLDNGTEDYMLFCFAALAKANLNDLKCAKGLYDKAIKIDSSMPVAWQGLYKLYSGNKLVADDRALDVCDKMMEISDNDEKKIILMDLKRNILFELSRYDILKEDLGTSELLMARIINKLSGKEILSTSEIDLLGKAFNNMIPKFADNYDIHLKYCQYQYLRNSSLWKTSVVDFCTLHGCSQEWIRTRLLELLAVDFFISHTFNDEWINFISSSITTHVDIEIRVEELIKYIRNDDLTSALDMIDNLSDSELLNNPIAYLVVHLLSEEESWERILKVLNWLLTQKLDSNSLAVAKGLKTRTLLQMGDLDEACSWFNSVAPLSKEFVLDSARIALLRGSNLEEITAIASRLDVNRIRILECLHTGSFLEGLTLGDELVAQPDASWSDLLLVSEMQLAGGKDPVALLVKAAKINPRSSRIFFILGKALVSKNPSKAKLFLERAVKIRPTNEEYVSELDDVLKLTGATVEQRLLILKKLAEKSKPLWLKKRLAGLFMLIDDRNATINELQQVLRDEPEDITSWALLAEVYWKRGHLQASVNAYEKVLELDSRSDYVVCLMQVLIRMHNTDAALERCRKWREIGRGNEDTAMAVNIIEAQIHLRLVVLSHGINRFMHLRRLFQILAEVIEKKPRVSLAFKLAGDALLHVVKYKETALNLLEVPAQWRVCSRAEAARLSVSYYAIALDLNRSNVAAWNDLAVALLVKCRVNNDVLFALRAVECLKKAISMSKCPQTRSQLWSRLSEAYRLAGRSMASQQHCLVRALQLSKANDEAWLRLAVLYYIYGEMDLCHEAFESALKFNPQLSEAWCGWAMKANAEGHWHEAMDMFRHSLSIKPIDIAVSNYCAFLCSSLRESRIPFEPSTVMINFDTVLDLYDYYNSNGEQFLLHLGVLAELFGHYADAVKCIEDSGIGRHHLERVRIKNGDSLEFSCYRLDKLLALTRCSTNDLYSQLLQKHPLYQDIFEKLVTPNAIGFKELYTTYYKSVNIPLIISAILRFKMSICDQAVAVLHEVLPRHELIDVFPTVMPEGLDIEFQYLEQDGEEPFRYRHYIAMPLLEVLRKLKGKQESST